MLGTVIGIGVTGYLGLLLFLFLFQDRLIYYPQLGRELALTPRDVGLDFEVVSLTTQDQLKLEAWFIPARSSKATVLFCHGNAGNISHRMDFIILLNRLGLNVLIFDYRGYGRSDGKPSEAGTYRDVLSAWHYLTGQRKIASDQIVVLGESLGGSIAAWLAAQVQPKALILVSAFTSVPELAQKLYPFIPARWLARFRYDTKASLASVNCPVLIMHGRQDEIVPFEDGRMLFNVVKSSRQFLEIQGGHNDVMLFNREIISKAIAGFLNIQ